MKTPVPPRHDDRRRVLVVDDDPILREILGALLDQRFDVVLSGSAEQALELLAGASFHVVCADYNMPGINGLKLLDQVALIPAYTSTLLLTGDDVFVKTLGGGRHYWLLKPFHPERVLLLVEQLASVADMRRSVGR